MAVFGSRQPIAYACLRSSNSFPYSLFYRGSVSSQSAVAILCWIVKRGTDRFDQACSIGVVVLDEPVEMETYGSLPSANLIDTLRKRSPFTVVGYGANDFATGGGSRQPIYPDIRQLATTEYLGTVGISNQVGEDVFMKATGSEMGKGGEGACYGDSGGPLSLVYQATIVGVTSFGPTSAIPCLGPEYA